MGLFLSSPATLPGAGGNLLVRAVTRVYDNAACAIVEATIYPPSGSPKERTGAQT
jgi:hypothetical protein